ncbi:MAG: H-NS histone family protein [Pseudomonadota bacterium]
MTSYKELLKQREALEAQINDARQRELSDAVSRVRGMIEEFGLTAVDVFPPARGRATPATKGSKVAAKYRDPATGATWTGRGKAPRWIQGEDRTKFAIN